MDIQTEKLGLIEWISGLSDISVVAKLKAIYEENTPSKDWWDGISEAERESYERGLKDWKEGRVHTHEDVKKLYEKYL